jgi:hypothetical protein
MVPAVPDPAPPPGYDDAWSDTAAAAELAELFDRAAADTAEPIAEPGPAPLGSTTLGLPYPTPTDLLADAALQVQLLGDAAAKLLANPGRIWGQDAQTANAYGGFWPYVGAIPAVQSYNLSGGFRGGTVAAANGYFYLFVLGGTWNSNAITCTVFPARGTGTGIPNIVVEYSFTGFGATG